MLHLDQLAPSGANELARQPLFIVGTHRQSGYKFRVFRRQWPDCDFSAGDSPRRLARQECRALVRQDESRCLFGCCEGVRVWRDDVFRGGLSMNHLGDVWVDMRRGQNPLVRAQIFETEFRIPSYGIAFRQCNITGRLSN